MDKQRTFFYGLIVGFVLLILPIPHFFFWQDVTDIVEAIFRYSGFVLMVVCGIPLIFDVFRNFVK
ncbi:hypothetical protein [Neobacillus sp. YIM B06451]|uniref:hypothetical protein n=1 Tax=Neobacillus sp. YIM B06451 TaxID=3070994 RepID=UPI00292F46CE|nr:hypothetical protein [Neobacillus sp. YIM B06451]